MSTKNQTQGLSPRNKFSQLQNSIYNVVSDASQSTTNIDNIYVKKNTSQ